MDLLECPAQLIALLRRAADEDSDDIAAAVEDELAEAWTWLVQSTKLPPTNQDPKKRQEIQAGEQRIWVSRFAQSSSIFL